MDDIKINDYVTRKKYNNDIIFKVVKIENEIYYLKGKDIRLYADSTLDDLNKVTESTFEENLFERVQDKIKLDRDEYFYLPGKILHLDGDNEYLERCMSFYKQAGVLAIGKCINERDIHIKINELLKEYNPDIVIITGHDALIKKEKNKYENSENFIKAVKKARIYENSHEKLIIIAGACQSNYEELIKAGANYASSPKRINIHALDPAIIAVTVALTERNQGINLIELLSRTKYGPEGIGGIIGNGVMYVGYPRA